jgi:transcriptional regulator with XRE-family HTH domain
MTTTTSRRSELAAFLRSRRERIAPEEVGLPTGTRRRTPGLRREEVAFLARVGVTWYTWLEQGRRINASVQVLDAIGRALGLDEAEREHLYRLADVPGVVDRLACDAVTPGVQAVLDGLVDLPASVINSRYDVLAWNAAYRAMWPGAPHQADEIQNLLWWSFVTPACCSSIVNRDAELPQMVGNFRAGYAKHLGEPRWENLVRRLCDASAEFSELWAAHGVARPRTRTKVFRHAAVGEVKFSITSLDVSAAPETRVSVYVPVDVADRERLDWLIAHPGAASTDHEHVAPALA